MILIAFEDFYGMSLTGFHLGFIAAGEGQLKLSVPLSTAAGGTSRGGGGGLFQGKPRQKS